MSEKETKIALEHHWKRLLGFPNVLNTSIGTKFKNSRDTGVPAIIVYVTRKVSETELKTENIIPKEIEGVPTDVVEFAPKTWTAGKTVISQLSPEEQRRRLGVIPTEQRPKRAKKNAAQPVGQSDWTRFANPIQDQGHCGSCVAFATTGVWEALLNITSGEIVKLSESHLFFCGGGRCSVGSTVPNILNRAMKGVCLESCLPYSPAVSSGVDEACGYGICDKWWLEAKKLESWVDIDDPTEILVQLDARPLVATMQVPQSFFNYTGGIYNRLTNDPIVGRHAIGSFGYSLNCYKIIRNSWGTDWGQSCIINGEQRPGWCTIAPDLLDSVMYQLKPDGVVPEPTPPPPPPCLWAKTFTRIVNKVLEKTGHHGRIYYQ